MKISNNNKKIKIIRVDNNKINKVINNKIKIKLNSKMIKVIKH